MEESMESIALWDLLGEWQLWAVCAVSFALGALGGLLHLGAVKPPPEGDAPPPKPTPWWRHVLVGGAAAVAVLYVATPETGIALVGGSIVAGYAGEAILAGLEARARLALAQQEVVETRRDVHEAVDALEEVEAASVGTRSRAPDGPPPTPMPPKAALTLQRLKSKYG
jgi:hypothetical protein